MVASSSPAANILDMHNNFEKLQAKYMKRRI